MKPSKHIHSAIFFMILTIFAAGSACATSDPMSPMYDMELSEPKANLAARPLAGKVVRFGYHTFWEVNKDKGIQGTPASMVHDVFFYENGECEWFSLDIFEGEHARQACGTVEVAPNIYQVSWLEPTTRQVVTQVLNFNTWTINTSFHFFEGKGLALFQGRIHSFGDFLVPPQNLPEKR